MNKIKIGGAHKKADRFVWFFNMVIVLVFLSLSFWYENAIHLFIVFFAAFLIESIRLFKRNYVSLEGSYFVIDRWFKQKMMIGTGVFRNLSKAPLLTTIFFSNDMVIHFKNGQRFRIRGGVDSVARVRQLIDDTLSAGAKRERGIESGAKE